MAVNVETFLERLSNTKKKGKLPPWESDIVKLRNEDVSYGQIVIFLSENGVKANRSEVYRFVNRFKRKHLLIHDDKKNTKLGSTKENHTSLNPNKVKQELDKNKTTLPKFDYKSKPKTEFQF